MEQASEFELKYSHNIIEHLGLKLYQNRPTNVLAELVSNSWDADAEKVWIDINDNHLAVYDNGIGMSRDVLINDYLVIGKRKRNTKNLESVTTKNRKIMGRKGIGKLAPFGIAHKLTLITVSKEDNLCYWIEINLSELLNRANDDRPDKEQTNGLIYKPQVICDGISVDNIPIDKDKHGYIKKFLADIKEKNGTLIIMDELSLKRSLNKDLLIKSIGQRFTVTLLRNDFEVLINNIPVTDKDALPNFVVRYPEEGYIEEIININGISRKVRHWVGFIEQADWPQDQAGVGVYAHGKIAQDRPFVFGLKGREITTRYMYGVIEADWLDELDEDIVSTDRTSINWNNDETEPVFEWGHKLVAKWISDYQKFQKERNKEKIQRKLIDLPNMPRVTEAEKEVITNMVCKMSPKIYRDEELQNEVLLNLTSAWTHRPTRNIIKNLWDQIEKSEGNESEFIQILESIHKYLVPESLSLSVTVAQKIYALTRLNELSINGTETQLQNLLETFPWILGSDKGKVYANTALKSLALDAIRNGTMELHGDAGDELKEAANATKRPDFTIFSDENKNLIYVVELKSPQVILKSAHILQLYTYFYWLQEHFPNATVKGYLIGKKIGEGLKNNNTDIKIMTWDEICLQSRKDYLELLAAMLHGVTEEYSCDARVMDVLEFGGEPTKELLKRLTDSDTQLCALLNSADRRLGDTE